MRSARDRLVLEPGLTALAWIALGLAFASAGFILIDTFGRGYRMKMPVMEAVWPVTALYARARGGVVLPPVRPDDECPLASGKQPR
jgi:hypothetical protein